MAENQKTNKNNTTLENVLKFGAAAIIGGAIVYGLATKSNVDVTGNQSMNANRMFNGVNIGVKDIYIIGPGENAEAYEIIKQSPAMQKRVKGYESTPEVAQDSTVTQENTIGWFQALRAYSQRVDQERSSTIRQARDSYQSPNQ